MKEVEWGWRKGKQGEGGRRENKKKSLIDRQRSGGTSGERDGARGEERPSAELSGHDQQMGGQAERNERDSWRDGGDKAEIGEGGGDAEQKHGDWPARKKGNKRWKRESEDVEKQREWMLTEERMIKCSCKQGWCGHCSVVGCAGTYCIFTWPVKWSAGWEGGVEDETVF